MDTKQIINTEYKELCQKKGHLQNNLTKIEKELAEIDRQISALDKAAAAIGQAEALQAEAAKRAAAMKADLSEEE